MLKRVLLACSLLLPQFVAAQDNDPGYAAIQKIRSAMMQAANGDVRGAWDLLYPEALAGSVEAMYALAQIMLSAGGPKNKEQAITLLRAAVDRGHPYSKVLLESIQNGVSVQTQQLANRYGVPVSEVTAIAKRAQSEFMSFLPEDLDSRDILINVFIESTSGYLETIYPILADLAKQYGNALGLKFFMVVDPEKWNAVDAFGAGVSNVPRIPFFPDEYGRQLKAHGFDKAPAIVLTVLGNDIPIGPVAADELRTKVVSYIRNIK